MIKVDASLSPAQVRADISRISAADKTKKAMIWFEDYSLYCNPERNRR